MALEFDFFNELLDVIKFTKTHRTDKTKCLICHHDESEDGEQWDRYELKCGHKYHTRCLRRWGHVKKCVNCPLCGNVDTCNSKNYFCSTCSDFGHSCTNCPKYKQFLNNENKKQKRMKYIKCINVY